MAKKLVDFLKAMITKAGGNPEDDAMKNAITTISADLELPDEVATAIDNGLLSVASAKNNHPDIKSHYTAQVLNGVDKMIDDLLGEEKLDDASASEIKAEKSSTKRIALLTRKIKEATTKAATANAPDKEAIARERAELNEQLRLEKEKNNQLVTKHNSELLAFKKGNALKTLLSGYKTTQDNLGPETRNIILDAVINKNLNTKGWLFGVDANNELILQDRDGNIPFGENNLPLTAKGFLDKIMADEKLIVVNDNTNNNNSNNNFVPTNRQNNNGHNSNGNQNQGGNNTKKGNAMVQQLVNETLKSLNESTQNSII